MRWMLINRFISHQHRLNQPEVPESRRYSILPYGQGNIIGSFLDLFERIPKCDKTIDRLCHRQVVLRISKGIGSNTVVPKVRQDRPDCTPLCASRQREFQHVMGEIAALEVRVQGLKQFGDSHLRKVMHAELRKRQLLCSGQEPLCIAGGGEIGMPRLGRRRIEAKQACITLELGVYAQLLKLRDHIGQQIRAYTGVSYNLVPYRNVRPGL